MSMKSCVEDAVARADISREDADEILRRYDELSKGRGPQRAQKDLERQLAVMGAVKKRNDLLTEKAKAQTLKDVMSYRTPHGGEDMIEAMYGLFEGFGHHGYPGVKQLHEGYLGLMHAKVADILDHFSRTIVTGKRRNKASHLDILKAAYGEPTTPQGKAMYESFRAAADWGTTKRNEFGGMTPLIKNYFPVSHETLAVLNAFGETNPKAAKARWAKYVNDRLDWTKMYDKTTGEFFPADLSEPRKLSILGHVWNTIATDGAIDIRPTMAPTGRASIAMQGAERKFLVFKDAKSHQEYSREFGKGDAFVDMLDHLNWLASDIALMQRFGPNPVALLGYLKQILDLQSGFVRAGDPHALGPKVTPKNAAAKVQRANHVLDAFFEQYRGEPPSHNWIALAGNVASNIATSALLGSSVIPHLASNWYIQTLARKAGGIPYMKVLPHLITRGFRGSTHEELLRAGLSVENGLFHVGAGAHQMSRLAKVANWSRWLPDRTTHWFGLMSIVEANKAAFNADMMGFLADHQKTAWSALPERLRSKMEGYGLRERHWRVMQTADLYEPSVGSAKWLRPTDVEDFGGPTDAARHESILNAYGRTSLDPTGDAKEAKNIAEETGMLMRAYMMGEREIAVPQSSMRAKAKLPGARIDRGTVAGFAARSFGIFKGFIGSFSVAQIHTTVAESARGRWHGARYAAAVFLGMTLGGMLSLQLKQLAAGKDFAPMNPLYRTGQITWLRAALTGGSFGIFGDYLASQHSSFGFGPLETLAGPLVQWPLAAAGGILDTIREIGDPHAQPFFTTTLPRAGVKFLRAMTPVLSTAWALRAAYNRMFLDQIERLVDREAYHKHRMIEERLHKETGQSFYWSPGEMLPSRMPHFTESRNAFY